MSAAAGVTLLYLLIISVSPQKGGQDIQKVIQEIARVLVNSADTKFLHTFKVTGEAKVITVVEVSSIDGLECTLGSLGRFREITTVSQPLITYDSFARNLGVSDNLTRPARTETLLQGERLYWVETSYNDYGNRTDEFLDSMRRTAEAILILRYEGVRVEGYKSLAERKEHFFVNYPSPDELDAISFQFPVVLDFGSNTHDKTEVLQLLDDYIPVCS